MSYHPENYPKFNQSTTLKLPKKSLEKLFSKNGFKILMSLSNSSKTVKELSSYMSISEQAIYYHIKKFLELGIISFQEEIEKLPSTTVKIHRYFLLSDEIILPILKGTQNKDEGQNVLLNRKYIKHPKFFRHFVKNNIFTGYIVVGSAITHGKYEATAQDGHYSGYLGYLLGLHNIILQKNTPFIKLDTEINKENLQREPLLVIGGPKVNVITSELQDNNYLPVFYDMGKTNTIFIKETQEEISDPLIGVLQLINNPWTTSKKNKIIIIAGPSRIGTQVAVFAITNFAEQIDNLFPETDYILLQGILDNKEDIIDVSFRKYANLKHF